MVLQNSLPLIDSIVWMTQSSTRAFAQAIFPTKSVVPQAGSYLRVIADAMHLRKHDDLMIR